MTAPAIDPGAAWPFPRRTCDRCRFWSSRIAVVNGNGNTSAVCLEPLSPKSGAYTGPREECTRWKPDTQGAVDDPTKRADRYTTSEGTAS